jgi:hypothetical protein
MKVKKWQKWTLFYGSISGIIGWFVLKLLGLSIQKFLSSISGPLCGIDGCPPITTCPSEPTQLCLLTIEQFYGSLDIGDAIWLSGCTLFLLISLTLRIAKSEPIVQEENEAEPFRQLGEASNAPDTAQ